MGVDCLQELRVVICSVFRFWLERRRVPELDKMQLVWGIRSMRRWMLYRVRLATRILSRRLSVSMELVCFSRSLGWSCKQ